MSDNDFRNLSVFILLLLILACGSFVSWVPALLGTLGYKTTVYGDVTSVSKQPFTTTVNFRDGSHFTLLGVYDIQLGNRTFILRLSWFWTSTLEWYT